MARKYKNLILSHHAEQRAKQRSIGLGAIHQTVNYPDIEKSQENNQIKFQKIIKNRHYQVIATYLREEEKWLILSTWVRGEEDKIPLIWQLIVFPFRLLYQILLWIFNSLINLCKSCNKK